jgi:uncharacterized oxidoreductase
MPILTAAALTAFVRDIFAASGVGPDAAQIVAESLVDANLKGHDSHGVIRVLEYVAWIEKGWIVPDAQLEIVRETDCLLLIDGHFGFGQIIGREASRLAIAKAKRSGVCVLSIRRSAHLGRIGEWMEMAAEAGLVAFSFTNTHGGGVLVAPYGGRDRRLSANPLGAGAPLANGEMLVMDFATSMIAEGKIKVARAKGEPLPPGCIVDGAGRPSTDAEAYYTDPGALLPFGGHKGFALSLFADVLAGALSGAGCSKAGVERVANAMLAVFLDPAAFAGETFFQEEVGALVEHIKSSPPMQGFSEILVPGEPEQREKQRRAATGIPIDATTWERMTALAAARGVASPETI